MPRVVSLFLPFFPTDRIKRSGRRPSSRPPGGAPSHEGAAPLVTVVRDGPRRIVASVDEAAHAIGLRPGQAAAQAQAAVPVLNLVEAEPEADVAALVDLAGWCLRYSPVVQPDPPDGLFVDVEGASQLFGGEAALLDDMTHRLGRAGLSVRAALADTPGAAWALARHQPGTIAPRGETALALTALPIAGLRLAEETCRGLLFLGMERIGDLARFSRASLTRRFGPDLMARYDQAHGRAAEPLTPLLPATTPRVTLAFAEPLGHLDGIEAAIARLMPELCRELGRRQSGLRRLDGLFRRVDGQPIGIRVGTAAPSRDPDHLARLVHERLPALDPGFGIDEVVLAATRIEPLRERQLVTCATLDLSGSGEGHAALAPLVDRLGMRVGPSRVFRAAPVESRYPERSVRRVSPLAPLAHASWPAALPRPSRIIDPPEPVTAFAVVPDAPPASFVWRRVRHLVRAADGPERVRGEWWRTDDEVESTRDYYRVEVADGRRFWLFRDAPMAAGGRWWLHGRFA